MSCFKIFRCQGRTQSSDDLLPIKAAHFVRNSDQEILPAFISNNRAILVFNSTTLHSVGKYRCEITTEDDQHIWGWLFVNSEFIGQQIFGSLAHYTLQRFDSLMRCMNLITNPPNVKS
ncbi:unnamed protein product [Anisakis simplex]|uniref:Ig-like domain-containing protein n=1 Tax=Anisakis simplex TaxID=6269 RepID=A0A0M3J2R4_ANISI|nr:unnamed protein product [Anisakis simplex]